MSITENQLVRVIFYTFDETGAEIKIVHISFEYLPQFFTLIQIKIISDTILAKQ